MQHARTGPVLVSVIEKQSSVLNAMEKGNEGVIRMTLGTSIHYCEMVRSYVDQCAT
jgi:hypothetical protein